MTGLGWIGELAHWIANFVPRIVIVQKNETGVRYKHGHKTIAIKPGIRVYWPVITNIEIVSSARRTTDLPVMTLTTKDGLAVKVKACMVWKIVDPIKAVVETFDIEGETVPDKGRKGVVPVIVSSNLEDLLKDLVKVEKKVTSKVRVALNQFGVKVEEVFFAELAQTKVYCISGTDFIPESDE